MSCACLLSASVASSVWGWEYLTIGDERSQGFEVLSVLHLCEVSLLFCLLYLESFSGRGEKNGLSDIIKTLKVKLKKTSPCWWLLSQFLLIESYFPIDLHKERWLVSMGAGGLATMWNHTQKCRKSLSSYFKYQKKKKKARNMSVTCQWTYWILGRTFRVCGGAACFWREAGGGGSP